MRSRFKTNNTSLLGSLTLTANLLPIERKWMNNNIINYRCILTDSGSNNTYGQFISKVINQIFGDRFCKCVYVWPIYYQTAILWKFMRIKSIYFVKRIFLPHYLWPQKWQKVFTSHLCVISFILSSSTDSAICIIVHGFIELL